MQKRFPAPGFRGQATAPNHSKAKPLSEPPQGQDRWSFHGRGAIGEKAQQLYDKTDIIEKAGFTINPRVVLTNGWFENFFERAGFFSSYYCPQEERLVTIEEGTFSHEEKATLREILRRFEGVPLAVRSSAEGDAMGTGIYHSGFCVNNGSDEENLRELERLVKEVLKSEYTDSAIEFKLKMGLPTLMSVMIEPVFGTENSGRAMGRTKANGSDAEAHCKWFSPSLSGCGYTSGPSGNGYVVVAGGLPTNAVSGKGLRIELNEKNISGTIMETDAYSEPGAPCLIEQGDYIHLSGAMGADAGKHEGNRSVPLRTLAGKLEALGKLAGRPQYVEFAGRFNREGEMEIAILQIADVETGKKISAVPEASENDIARSNEVIGEGTCICKGVFLCPSPSFLHELRDFNRKTEGYLLIVDSFLLSDMCGFPLEFAHFSNASAIIVRHNHSVKHSKSVSEHFKGLSRATGKLVLIADWGNDEYYGGPLYDNGILYIDGRACHSRQMNSGAIELDVKVSVSEAQNKGIATIIGD